jgi:hypothetical protein
MSEDLSWELRSGIQEKMAMTARQPRDGSFGGGGREREEAAMRETEKDWRNKHRGMSVYAFEGMRLYVAADVERRMWCHGATSTSVADQLVINGAKVEIVRWRDGVNGEREGKVNR